MIITENNYEEYFLLYTDNELNAAERNAVEAFVQQHPQYASVLDMYLQTKLSGEESILFGNKESLYKSAEAEIGIDNYEDYFLLYTDNELSEEDKKNTERFVLQHPRLQAEFTLLQQARLSPENIVYPDKKELYRQEKERRVLPLYFTWIATAAAIFILVLFAWIFVPSGNNTSTAVAKHIEIKKPVTKPEQVQIQPQTQTQSQINNQSKEKQSVAVTQKYTEPVQKELVKQTDHKKSVVQPVIIATVTQAKKQVTDDNIVLPETLESKAQPQLQVALVENNEKVKADKQATVLKPLELVSDDDRSNETALSASDDNIIKPAVYKELSTDNEDQTLYVGSLQLNKAKVNGFLKSASRLFGNKVK